MEADQQGVAVAATKPSQAARLLISPNPSASDDLDSSPHLSTGNETQYPDHKLPSALIIQNNAITRLTTAALAIPASAYTGSSVAAVAPEAHKVSLRVTQYLESDMPTERVTVGAASRYSIDVLQFSLQTPLNNQKVLNSYVAYETMSGASPLQSRQNSSDQTEVLMSGASIEEKRVDANVSLSQYSKNSISTGSLAVSKENDYESFSIGFDGSIENNNKHLTLLASVSASADKISPTDAQSNPIRAAADGESKTSVSGYFGFNQVLNRYSTLQLGISVTQLSGYLSDPYRISDNRPEQRNQNTITLQYREFNNALSASTHFDYRYYQDDWDILAHTIETSLWKDISFSGMVLTLVPSLRYYWQHQAKFYNLDSSATAVYKSSDYRLSAYGSIKFGMDVVIKFKQTRLTIAGSQYFSGESLGLTGSQSYETPSLVNFTTVSFGIEYQF